MFAENPRFPGEGSSTQGESGPKPRPKGVGDGYPVNIPEPLIACYATEGRIGIDQPPDGWGFKRIGRGSRQNPELQFRGVMSTWIASEGEVIDSWFQENLRCDVVGARTVIGHT